MGEVYRAEDLKLGRTVALKVVLSENQQSEQARRRLWQEARAASSLNHPNIVTIHALEQAEGLDFFVMEYVEGESLSRRLERGSLPLSDLLDLGIRLAEALGFAHDRNLLHRDIKPSNIFLTSQGQVKLLDFGLAKAREAVESAETMTTLPTQEGVILGTLSYMSPEQARGETLDGRSDLFSLGAVLYEVATGRRPFQAPTTLALLHQIATVDPPPPSTLRPDLPEVFDAIAARALAKNKEHRWASAAELARALQSMQSTGASPAREPENEAFVGREPEMRKLEALLERAAQGSGRIVFIIGEPGIGKSALASRFLARAAQLHPGLLVGRGHCVEQYGTGEAYLPFLDAVGGLLSGNERGRVMTVLRSHAPTWCLQLPAAFDSTGDLAQLQRETIGATKERMLREMGDALRALSAPAPVALLLEDLHWADPSSTDLLRHLSERASAQRLLVIGTFRPNDVEARNHPLKNYKREMQAHQLCDEIPLSLLSREHVTAYLEARFVPNNFPKELAELIHRKTEGHALFATGLVQYLSERGEIVKPNGHWTLVRPPQELDLEVPESVRGMISNKIDALPEEDRRALEYASVEGEEFTSTVLARLLEIDELFLEERLDRVKKAHGLLRMLGEEQLPDGSLTTRYQFAHALYQNALYAALLPKRRALLHRQAGEELLRRHGCEAARIAASLASHFELGRDLPRAIDFWIQAGDNAVRRFDNSAAIDHYSRALGLCGQLPAEKRAGRESRLYGRRARAHQAMAWFPEAERDYKAMLERARAGGERVAECQALIGLCDFFFWCFRLEGLRAAAEEALHVADLIGNAVLRSQAMEKLSLGYLGAGELDKVKALLDEAIEIARPLGQKAALAPMITGRGRVPFFEGEYERAVELLQEGLLIAAEVGDGFNLTQCLFFLGMSQGNLGRISEALATFNQAIEMAQRNGNRMILTKVPNCLGWIYSEMGDTAKGIEQNQICAASARKAGLVEAETNALVNLAHDHLQNGEPERSRASLERAEAISDRDPWLVWRFDGIRRQAAAAEYWLGEGHLEKAAGHAQLLLANSCRHKAPKYMAKAHRVRAEIAARRGELAEAEKELSDGIAALREHPAALEGWKIQAALGRLRRRAGNPEGSRLAFAEASAIIRSIAGNTSDDELREKFLNLPDVQEALGESKP